MKRRSSPAAAELVAALESERQQLTQELHGGLCQTLTGLAFLLETLKGGDVQGHELAGTTTTSHSHKVERVRELMRTAVQEANALNDRLAALNQSPEDLVRRLEKLAAVARGKTPCELILEEGAADALQTYEARTAFYRIAQEAVASALRQLDVEHLCVRLHRKDALLRLEITDDGGGESGQISPESRRTMNAYARAIGARLTVKSVPQGTTVRCAYRGAVSR